MKFRDLISKNMISEAKSAKDILINLHNMYYDNDIGDEIEDLFSEINPYFNGIEDFSEKECQSVLQNLSFRIKKKFDFSYYLENGVPDDLNIRLTKTEFHNMVQKVTKNNYDYKTNLPYKDDKYYDELMYIYNHCVK